MTSTIDLFTPVSKVGHDPTRFAIGYTGLLTFLPIAVLVVFSGL